MKYTKAPTAPQRTVVDLDGGQTVTADEELLLDFETERVPLQDGPIAAAGERLPGDESTLRVRPYYDFFWLIKKINPPVLSTSGVSRESSHFMSVFCQLFVAGHGVSVHDVDDGVLRADPNLIMDQSQHAGLHRNMVSMCVCLNCIRAFKISPVIQHLCTVW